MQRRKIILLGFNPDYSLTTQAFCQTEVLKSVVNNLAFYKQKNDLKYLSNAKRSIDSLIKTPVDSADIEKNVYRAVVNSSILYIDSLNKLNRSRPHFLNKPVILLMKAMLQIPGFSNSRQKWIIRAIVWPTCTYVKRLFT